MFGLIAPLLLASAAAPADTPQQSTDRPTAAPRTAPADRPAAAADDSARSNPLPVAPWWEKFTVTMTGDGNAKSCKYETSTRSEPSGHCALAGADFGSGGAETKESAASQYLKLTFERRFSLGDSPPPDAPLATGDTLLGREVMAIAIGPRGKVTGCKIESTSGDMPPDYNCDDASAERFAEAGLRSEAPVQGFFTIRIYGHSEHFAMLEDPTRRA